MKTSLYSLIVLSVFLLPGFVPSAPAQTDSDCVGGKPIAPVKIEVFSDYQCPACRQFYLETMRQVLSDYADKGKVCVMYREFPLSQHQYAREAARYGHAAQRLGQRMWAQVTDALYQAQDRWEQDGKIEPVVAAALTSQDMALLKKEMSNPAVNAAIDRDIARARELEVNQTPTFLITANGKTDKKAGIVSFPILQRYLNYVLGQ